MTFVHRVGVAMIAAVAVLATEPVSWVHAEVVVGPTLPKHAIYVEVLGKGGVWGLGYQQDLRPWLGLGAVASFIVLDGQWISTLAPYLTAYPLGRGQHRWFVDVGPEVVYLVTPSPVPEWAGTSDAGVAGHLSSGYEFRGSVFVRAYAMGIVGRYGIAPWAGVSIGWSF